jgi:ABC-type dipeptide/oligopeptide/nickel transport system permease component
LGLSSGIICELSRVIEEAMETELSKEYIETATAKGLVNSPFPWIGTIRFHAFRNALITILPQVSLIFTFVISGSLVVEQVFDLPGVSFMLLKGLGDKDMARVLVIILIGVLLIRIGSILSNLAYLLLNPKYGESM